MLADAGDEAFAVAAPDEGRRELHGDHHRQHGDDHPQHVEAELAAGLRIDRDVARGGVGCAREQPGAEPSIPRLRGGCRGRCVAVRAAHPASPARGGAQCVDERPVGVLARIGAARAQHVGRVKGRDDETTFGAAHRRRRALQRRVVILQYRAQRRGAERDHDARPQRIEFALEPVAARGDLALRRRLVQAPLAAWFPFEMLDRVRQVDVCAFDAGFVECAIEHASGRADERHARAVFLVARLLADEHDARIGRTRAGHRLCRVLP